METALMQWFANHAFIRNELILILGAVSGIAKKDWESFKAHKVGEPDATFSWRVAGLQYIQGVLIGAVPPLVAEIWKVLGS